MSDGVELPFVYCPTCGEQFRDFNLRSDADPDDFDVDAQVSDILAKPLSPTHYYICCPNRHMWTIKTICRSVNKPDRILLGKFLGTEL